MIIFRPPSDADLIHIAANMREMDKLECAILGNHEPLQALRDGVDASDWCFAAEVEGEAVCVFGVASDGLLSDDGSPWLLGTKQLERCARELLTGTKAYFPRMCEQYETLSNYVHAHNRQAIRYLKWCGFSFGEEVMVRGEPFVPFSMDCKVEARQAA